MGAAQAEKGSGAEDPIARMSFFQSSMSTLVGDRADTLKKIDEIEAHMSQQWWKSDESNTTTNEAESRVSAPTSLNAKPISQSSLSMPTLPPGPEIQATLDAFDALEAQAAEQSGQGLPVPDSSGVGATADMAGPGAAPAYVTPAEPGHMVATTVDLQEAFMHDPDLEEAAIRFANGDYSGAEVNLKDVLTQHAADPPAQQLEIWKTLFDLYRATGQHAPFELAALQFAGRFERSAPQWFSMPAQQGLVEKSSAQAAALAKRDFAWNSPPTITLQTVTALQAALGRAAPPWQFAWTRVSAINPDAVPVLTSAFTQWAEQTEPVVFVGANHLRALLETQTPPGERAQNPDWWFLRMAALRLMGLPDEFESVALDYCVTYEVSPPSWLPPRCRYQGDSGAGAVTGHADSGLHSTSGWAPSSLLGGPHSRASVDVNVDGLVGVIEGDATAALEEVVAQTPATMPLVVPCQRLIRIDFSAAGAVLNWAAEQHGKGRVVEFVQLHRLAAVFFNVVGISEYGSVAVREG